MLVLNAFERIKEMFPHTESLIIKELDLAQKELAGETKLLEASGSLSSPTSNFAWNLPSDFLEAIDVVGYDSDSEPKYLSEDNIVWEIMFDKLFLKSMDDDVCTYFPTGYDSVYLHYYKKPVSLTSTTSSFSINEILHEGIVSRVLEKFHSRYPVDVQTRDGIIKARDWQAVRYFKNEFKEYLRKAKKFKNSQNHTTQDAIFYDSAGLIEIPKRAKDSTVSSVSVAALGGLADIYSKYLLIQATEGEATGTNLGQMGYTGTITATISGNTVTITSTENEFGTYVDAKQSNNDMGFTRTSANTITLDGYTGWTGTKAQIYETLL